MFTDCTQEGQTPAFPSEQFWIGLRAGAYGRGWSEGFPNEQVWRISGAGEGEDPHVGRGGETRLGWGGSFSEKVWTGPQWSQGAYPLWTNGHDWKHHLSETSLVAGIQARMESAKLSHINLQKPVVLYPETPHTITFQLHKTKKRLHFNVIRQQQVITF